MAVEVFHDTADLPTLDLMGVRILESVYRGIVNRRPLRRRAVPYEAFDLFAGNNRRLRVLVRDEDTNIVDVTGATALFTVKETKNSASSTFQRSTDVSGEGEIGAADKGELFFYVVPANTSGLSIRQYVFDVKLTLAAGTVYTVVEGVLNLQKTVG